VQSDVDHHSKRSPQTVAPLEQPHPVVRHEARFLQHILDIQTPALDELRDTEVASDRVARGAELVVHVLHMVSGIGLVSGDRGGEHVAVVAHVFSASFRCGRRVGRGDQELAAQPGGIGRAGRHHPQRQAGPLELGYPVHLTHGTVRHVHQVVLPGV
jgi:hypothetical protein